jgi:WD40-like Beta Propeller Repeat
MKTDSDLDRQLRSILRKELDYQNGPDPSWTESPAARRVTESERRRRRFRWPLRLLAVAALIGGIGGGALLFGGGAPEPAVAANGWIAFSTQPGFPEAMHECCGSGGDIYLVRDGVEPKLIVSRGSSNTSNVCPTFSPDGQTLAYGHRDGASRALILLAVGADGSTSEIARLDVPGDSNVPCARWSTDGARLAYLDGLSRDGQPAAQPARLVVRGLDGSTLVPGPTDPTVADLSRTSSFVDSNTPLRSPSGDWVALADDRGVVVERPDGSDARVLMTPEGFGALMGGYCCALTPYSIPAWSPDGTFVLAMGDVGGPSFTLAAISVENPSQSIALAQFVAVNSASNWPVRGDVSWQPVYGGSTP